MKKAFLLLIIYFFFITSCEYFTLMSKKEWEEKSGKEDDVIIYVAGVYNSGDKIPCYWKIKNDKIERIDLEYNVGLNANIVYSIFVVGDTVYTCGNCDSGTNNLACYWINSKKHDLEVNSTLNNSQANSITIKNGVVFIAGSENVNGCFWIDDNKSNLSSFYASTSIFINQISSSKHVLYISGQNTDFQACIYKDGEIINLPNNGADLSGAYSIFIYGNTLYSTGILRFGANINACLWKNNNLLVLPNGQLAYSVFVSVDDVYVVGQDMSGLACYWKNNNFHQLSNLASSAQSIFILNDKVYIAGQEQSWASLWINKKIIHLDSASSMAYSIFVKPDNE